MAKLTLHGVDIEKITDAAGNVIFPVSTTPVPTGPTGPGPTPTGPTSGTGPAPTPGAIQVGPTRQYKNIRSAVAAAPANAVIEVDEGTYTNDTFAVSKAMTIKGLGRVVIQMTEWVGNGKGIIIAYAPLNVEGIEFRGARVADQNGAGIRHEIGDLSITNCKFDGCEMGLLSTPHVNNRETITIKNTEFGNSRASDALNHNIYVSYIKELILDGVYSHNQADGHALKSRAFKTTVLNSRIHDGTRAGDRTIDISNGGVVLIKGCSIQQSALSPNSQIIGYSAESAPHPVSSFLMEGNTVINDKSPANPIMLYNFAPNVTCEVKSTKVWGITQAQLTVGPANVSGTEFLPSRPTLP